MTWWYLLTNLEVASCVDEDVSRLEIPVDDPCRVHVVEAAEDLVKEELQVRFLEVLTGIDNVVQVLHSIRYTVYHRVQERDTVCIDGIDVGCGLRGIVSCYDMLFAWTLGEFQSDNETVQISAHT